MAQQARLTVILVVAWITSVGMASGSPYGFRLMIPGEAFPPAVYRWLPWTLWETVSSHVTFVDCEKAAVTLREEARNITDRMRSFSEALTAADKQQLGADVEHQRNQKLIQSLMARHTYADCHALR